MSEIEHQTLTLNSRQGWREWETFLSTASGATPYHREAWLQSVAEGMAQDIRIHTVLNAGRILSGAVVRRGGRPGLRVASKPWATAYNGVVTDAEAEPRHVEALYAWLRREYVSVRLVQAPGAGFSGNHQDGWSLGSWPTFLLDIRDPIRLWDGCDRRVRQRVRKARDLGVSLTHSQDAEIFEGLYRQTYERQGLAMSLPLGSISRTVGAASARGLARLHVASTSGGEPAAALVLGHDARRAYFMLAASHPRLRHTDAVTLLWWTALEDCSTRVGEVDLVGTGTPEIERFKRSFSPKAVDCADAAARTWRGRLVERIASTAASLYRGAGRA